MLILEFHLKCVLRMLNGIELMLDSTGIQIQTSHTRYLITSSIVHQQTQFTSFENLTLKETAGARYLYFLGYLEAIMILIYILLVWEKLY